MLENQPGNQRKRLRSKRTGGSFRRSGEGASRWRSLRYEWLEERQLLSAVNPVGSEFQVNTYTAGAQDLQQIATDSAGDFVVVWQSSGQDGSGYGIYGQRYSSSGVTDGSEFRVNTYTTGNQTQPSVAMDSEGDFVVAWSSQEDNGPGTNGKYGVYAQRYSSSGAAVGSEFLVNTYTPDAQRRPSVAMDSVGDFVIAWQSYSEDGSQYGVYAQRYSSVGAKQGSEFKVNTYTTNSQEFPSVAMDSGGDFVVTWSSLGQDGSSYGIYGQRYNSSGAVQGSEFRINTYTTGQQVFSTVAMDAQGDFAVTWTSYGEDGSSGGIYAQRYNSSGAAQGNEFRVNTDTVGNQNLSSISMDSSGDFVVTWASAGEDGSGDGVYAQYYATGGTPVGGEFQVNTFTAGNQGGVIPGFNSGAPVVALVSGGSFEIAWGSAAEDGSSYGVYAQRYQLAIVAPVVAINTGPLTYTVESGAQDIDSKVTVSDGNSPTLASATVTIASGYSTPQDTLQFFNQSGITGVFNADNGTETLTGIATVGQYQAALQSITYTNISANPSFVQRIVTYTVNDGASISNTATTEINVVAAAPASLVFVTQPPSTITAGSAFGVTVEVEDIYGNVANNFTGSVSLILSTNPGSDTLGGTTSLVPNKGVAVFSGLTMNIASSGYTLEAFSGGLTSPNSNGFTVVLGPSIVTGTGALTYSVQTGAKAIDPGLTFTDPESSTVVSATVTIASGYASPEDVLSFTNQNGITGVFSAATGSLVLSGSASVSQYQTALQSVAYQDTANNPSFAQRTVTYTAYDGIISNSPTPYLINVVAGTATQLIVSSSPPSTVSAGIGFGMTVTAEDFYGNLATSFSGTVSVTLANNPTLTTLGGVLTATASGGQAVFSQLILDVPGNGYSLNVNSGTLTGNTSSQFSVVPGPATQLVLLSQPPKTVTAGAGFGFTVAAEDSVGNINTSYASTVSVVLFNNPGGSVLSGTSSVTVTGGEAVFSGLALNKADPGYTLRLTANSLSATVTNGIAVTASSAAQLAIISQPSTVTAGTPFALTLAAEDSFGNLVTGFSGSLTVALSNNPGNSTLGGSTIVNASGGTATFSTLTLNKVATGYTLVTSSGNLAPITTNGIAVVPGIATQLIVSAAPVNVTVGANFGLTVQALDAEGNLATGFSGSVTAAISNNPGGATLGGTTTHSASHGVAVFTGLKLNVTGGGYTLALTDSGLTPAPFGPFNVTPVGQAIELAFVNNQPPTVTAGTPFAVTLDAVDGFGNVDHTYDGTITMSLANNPGLSTLGGTVTVGASSGVAVFSTLTLNIANTGYVLSAAGGTLTSATSNSITVIPGAATQLIVIGEPPSTTPVFTGFGITAIAEDAEGNLATSFQGDVNVALAGGPTGSSLGGVLSVTATNGVAVFSGLTTNVVGTGYILQVTSGGLTSANTVAFSSELATLTIAGAANDAVTVTFTDATDFTVVVDGGAPVSYSTEAYDKLVYNGPTGSNANLIFQDPVTTDDYTATQSLSSTILTRSGGASFEFDANSVSALYIYVADPSSTATVNVTSGTGSNFYVDATNLGYSYIADPVALIYSELSGFGNQTVTGSGGSTYAYVYSTSHAIVIGDAGQSSITYGSVVTGLSNFAQIYTVGAADGSDSITLHTDGGGFVGTPSFSYVSGTSNGQTFLIGALYCATVTAFATNPTDSAFFYSYSTNTFNGSNGQSELLGSTSAFATLAGIKFTNFVSQATGFQNVTVQESGTGKDVANLTANGNSVLTTTPNSSTLTVGSIAVVTVDTFFNNNGTFVAVLARINATGTSTDTADLYDSAGTNTLVAKANTATLTTPVNTVAVKQFGFVNAYASSGTSDTVSEQALDFALGLVGNWTTA